MSKGSHRRPTDEKKFSENFDAIFRKPEPVDLSQESLDEILKDIEFIRDNSCGVILTVPTRSPNE